MSTGKRGRPPKQNKQAPKVKRTPNAFLLFHQDVRPLISKDSGTDPSIVIGHMWNSLPPEKKKPYQERANQLDEVHRLLYPSFLAPCRDRDKYPGKRTMSGDAISGDTESNSGPKAGTSDVSETNDCDEEWTTAARHEQPIEPAPWSSPSREPDVSVDPGWCKRGRQAKNPPPRFDIDTDKIVTETREVKSPIIPHPSKVRFRIVPAWRPYVYVSREEKRRRKKLEEQKKNEENMRILHQDESCGASGNVNLSTPVLVKCRGKHNTLPQEESSDNSLIDMLPLMPLLSDSNEVPTSLNKESKNVAKSLSFHGEFATSSGTNMGDKNEDYLSKKQTSLDNEDCSDMWNSPALSMPSFAEQDGLGNPISNTGGSDWWSEFEFLCSPMSKASISLTSFNPMEELSEDPLDHLTEHPPPDLESSDSIEAYTGTIASLNVEADSPGERLLESLSLPAPTNCNLNTLLSPNENPSQEPCGASDTNDKTEDIQVGQTEVDNSSSSCREEFSYTTTPTEQSLAKLTASTIEESERVTLYSESSLCESQDLTFLPADYSSILSSSAATNFHRRDEQLNDLNLETGGNDPKIIGGHVKAGKGVIFSSTPKTVDQLPILEHITSEYTSQNTEEDSSPDLSPYLQKLSHMSSPLPNESSVDQDSTAMSSHLGASMESWKRDAIPLGKLGTMDTPRTPIKTTEKTIESLKKHPISKLTSPDVIRSVEVGERQHRDATLCSNPRFIAPPPPKMAASPGKRRLSSDDRHEGGPSKRGRYMTEPEAEFQGSNNADKDTSQPKLYSCDSETQSAVEALLGIQF